MKPLLICFENHREDGKVWAVKQGRRWYLTEKLTIQVPVQSVYKGKQAKQPKAYFVGLGRLTGDAQHLVIHA